MDAFLSVNLSILKLSLIRDSFQPLELRSRTTSSRSFGFTYVNRDLLYDLQSSVI